MQRPSIWLMLVIFLGCLFFLREPRLQRFDDSFLRWLLRNAPATGATVPLTIVDIGGDSISPKNRRMAKESPPRTVSPVEYALFLQAVLEFTPTVVAFEPILQWDGKQKDQEQIFLDQAMRVPKMLSAAELTVATDPDAPVAEVPAFTQVTGKRGGLVEFSGISRQPNEDLRVISTLGFINLPKEASDDIHVPLLFQYRGEVIPSFSLQALLLWMRVTPSEVKIDIGSYIYLPQGKKIPIGADGSLLVNPITLKGARHLKLNELLLGAQQHENKAAGGNQFEDIRDHIVLARGSATDNEGFDAAIATVQANAFVHRIHWMFDVVFIIALATVSGIARRFSRIDLVLAAIAVSAGYAMLAIVLISRWYILLPGVLPLGAMWLLALLCLFAPRAKDDPDLPAIAPSPPSL
jgi:CHASE2 domain